MDKHTKTLLLFLLFITTSHSYFGQIGADFTTKDFLKLEVDSVEMKITKHKRGSDTSYVLHYGIVNLTSDTIFYKWQSCPSYRGFVFRSEPSFKNFNSNTCCSYTMLLTYKIAPYSKHILSEPLTRMSIFKKKKYHKPEDLYEPYLSFTPKSIKVYMVLDISKEFYSSAIYTLNSEDSKNEGKKNKVVFKGVVPFVKSCSCAEWDKKCQRKEQKSLK